MNRTCLNISGVSNCSQAIPFYLSYGEPWLQAFCTYITPVIVILGLIGNSCSFIILKESATRVSSHFYLCCLSVLDSLTLLSIMFTIWLAVILPGYYYVTFGQVAKWLQLITSNCEISRFRVYVSYYCRMVSVWTVVILSVERCIAVSSPLRWGTKLCTVRNGIWAIGALLLLAAPFSVYALFGFTYQAKYGTCKANNHFFIGNLVSNVLFSIAPWLVIAVSNTLLVLVLRKRNRRSSQLDSKTLRQENSVTMRLLVVSVAFLFFTLPLAVTTAINSKFELQGSTTHKTGILADVWLVGFVLFTSNFSANFVLYCLTGQNFRRAALALLTFRVDRMRLFRRRLDRGASDSGGSSGAPSSKLTNAGSLTKQDMQQRQQQQQQQRPEPSQQQTAPLIPKSGPKHLRLETNI